MGRYRRDINDIAEGENRIHDGRDLRRGYVDRLRLLHDEAGNQLLTERQADVLYRVYALGITKKECAEMDKVTPQSIRKIYSAAWGKVKRYAARNRGGVAQ